MEMENVKAAWQREKAACPVETDTQKILADTKKQALKRDLIFDCQQGLLILCGLICFGLMATWYNRQNPMLSNAGLILMILGFASMLGGIIILRQRQRISHPWLPDEAYLAEERMEITARIALFRGNLTWLLTPSVLGFLLWQLPLSHTVVMTMILITHVVLFLAGVFWLYHRKVRKELRPMFEEIDLELAELRNHPRRHQARSMPNECEFK